ncbi:MAG: hypothetical protein WC428_07680 [Candidatus Paceibacterota bacterium]|jgi:hypothetical protein
METLERPYPNEHACRLRQPNGNDTRRENGEREHDGKKYDVIYQKKDDASWEEQAYRYPREVWTAESAHAHCKQHNGILFEPATEEEKTMTCKQVRYGELRSIDDSARTAEFIISSGTRDRHKTVLNPKNWALDNYRKNPIVGYDHDIYGGVCAGSDPDKIIGKSEIWQENDQLIARVIFEPESINQMAEKIRRKVAFGTLRAASVGFYPISVNGEEGYYGEGDEERGKPNETFYYYGQELVEWSIVNIPSNPDAVKKALRSQVANALLYLQRELGNRFTIAEIEKLRIFEAIAMLDNPEKRKKKSKTDVLVELIEESIGKSILEIEGLTVKGLLSVFNGDDIEKILKADGKRKSTYGESKYHEYLVRQANYR